MSPTDNQSNQTKRAELIASIREDRLIVVTGTGVTMPSVGYPAPGTEVAGWQGLLSHGVDHCTKLGLMAEEDAEIARLQIQRGVTERLIDAAQAISDSLDQQQNGRLWWLRETVGRLKVTEPSLIRALQRLGGLMATLNYDSSLSHVTGRPPVNWTQQTEITRNIRSRSKDFILHMHGQWEAPDSVVLDRRSYEAISHDVKMQGLLHRFARFETMLFAGCGKTFFDPNFQTLLKWAHEALSGAEHRHFILCRDVDESELLESLKAHGYLTSLVYGHEYQDLKPFLEGLATEGGVSTNIVPSKAATIGSEPLKRLLRPLDIWNQESQS